MLIRFKIIKPRNLIMYITILKRYIITPTLLLV